LEFIDEFVGEVAEDFGILGFYDPSLAIGAVAQGVETGFKFTFAGFRAGAFAGVASICFSVVMNELFFTASVGWVQGNRGDEHS